MGEKQDTQALLWRLLSWGALLLSSSFDFFFFFASSKSSFFLCFQSRVEECPPTWFREHLLVRNEGLREKEKEGEVVQGDLN